MASDPICHMTVDEKTGLKGARDGQAYYFCSLHCKEKFEAGAKDKLPENLKKVQAQGIYTCPMHPEVRQGGPGDCPKCGMALEPINPISDQLIESNETNQLRKKFWIGLFLTVPVVFLAMSGMSMPGITRYIQWILSTIVVFYCGSFLLVKGWQSLVNRHLNMFTLIGLGVIIAYGYSILFIFISKFVSLF